MSEKTISLAPDAGKAGVHYLESYIRYRMKPLQAGYRGVDLVLGKKDTAWKPDGGRFRGPAGIQYVLTTKTGRITALDDDDR